MTMSAFLLLQFGDSFGRGARYVEPGVCGEDARGGDGAAEV
jgi:hypothetical protein